MFRLEKDTDSTWIEGDFGSGTEKYKVSYYSPQIIIELLKKYGHRDPYFWRHKKTKTELIKKPKDIDNYEQLERVYGENVYDVTDANALKLRQEAICTVLLNWDKSIQDKDGNPVQCGEAEKKQLVISSVARSNWILLRAANLLSFLPDLGQVAKNSERPSSTKKNTETAKNNSPIAEPVSQ